jgi:hypothetical protein
MSTWRVVIVREGPALSGRTYTRGAVADIARHVDGLRCFADHPTILGDRLQPARSVRDLVGQFADAVVREVSPESVGLSSTYGPCLAVEATLHLMAHAGWVDGLAVATTTSGREVVGLSIDALARLRPGTSVVEAVPVVRSCDVVTRASAGGRFLHRLDAGGGRAPPSG